MDILTDEHKELINKKIKKALNEIDFTQIVMGYIEREFEGTYDESGVSENITDMVTEVIKQHLVKSGLLKDEK